MESKQCSRYILERYSDKSNEFIQLSSIEIFRLKAKIIAEYKKNKSKLIKLEEERPLCSSNCSRKEFIKYYEEQKEWIKTYRQVSQEADAIINCVESLFDTDIEDFENAQSDITTDDDTLYIYKGKIICHNQNHQIEQATAILNELNGNDIEINVEHCMQCNKFFLQYGIYNRYREKYGFILGNIKFLKGTSFTAKEIDLAEESPLHLCGYNVSQKDGLTSTQRKDIITACIETGTMTKDEIVRLLNWLIERNGAKLGNELAVKKWSNDLDFILSYEKERQKQYFISKIEKYHRNKFLT